MLADSLLTLVFIASPTPVYQLLVPLPFRDGFDPAIDLVDLALIREPLLPLPCAKLLQ